MAALLISLTGCAKVKNRTNVIVIDGFWHTPDGKIEFERTNGKEMSERFDVLENNSKAYLIAERKKQGVVINPIHYGPIFIFGGLRDQVVRIYADQAFYEVLEPGADTWSAGAIAISTNQDNFECHIPDKPCRFNFGVPFIGQIIQAEQLYGYRIRYHIPYSTGDKDFLIDVTLEFKKDRFIDWSDWHFPGSP